MITSFADAEVERARIAATGQLGVARDPDGLEAVVGEEGALRLRRSVVELVACVAGALCPVLEELEAAVSSGESEARPRR